jgi:hypothetical protein
MSAVIFWMWASQGSDDKGYALLACNVARVLVNPTFRNNISPPCSGPKNRPNKETRKLWALLNQSVFLFGGVGLGSYKPQYCGHTLAYCTFSPNDIWGWLWSNWWSERRLQGKPKHSEKTCPSSTLSHHKSHMPRSGFEPRPAAVGSQRLTAWAMARPNQRVSVWFNIFVYRYEVFC